jgi:hypothetical protein
MPNESNEYRLAYIPWFATTGQAQPEQIAIFSELEQISDWIEECRKQSIRITIHSLHKCVVSRSEWEELFAEKLYMQQRTGQLGIPTVEINLKLRKQH